MMKFQFDANAQNALRQSGISNIFGGASDIAGGMMQFGNYQNAKDYNKILAGMGASSPTATQPMPTPMAGSSTMSQKQINRMMGNPYGLNFSNQ
jgi:hypothetical protein